MYFKYEKYVRFSQKCINLKKKLIQAKKCPYNEEWCRLRNLKPCCVMVKTLDHYTNDTYMPVGWGGGGQGVLSLFLSRKKHFS